MGEQLAVLSPDEIGAVDFTASGYSPQAGAVFDSLIFIGVQSPKAKVLLFHSHGVAA